MGREDLVLGDDDGVLLFQPPALWTSSRLRRQSATPSDAKPNGRGQGYPCAVSCSSTATLPSANERLL